MNNISSKRAGFTIVELLIVIVVIAILAAISIVAYAGIQDRANKSKVQSDIAQIVKAVTIAREQESTTLRLITGSGGTMASCVGRATNTNLAALPQTDSCWTAYNSFLNIVSEKSGMDIRGLKDPWGRPYYIDENEGENVALMCTKDTVAMYTQPFVTGYVRHSWTPTNNVPLSRYGGCTT